MKHLSHKLTFSTIAAIALLSFASCESKSKNTFTDTRDGHTYKYVRIGKQIWMAENLNYYSEGSYCYNHDERYCDIYGRLYSFKDSKNVCPEGWHLPSPAEWKTLTSYAGKKEDPHSDLASESKLIKRDSWLGVCHIFGGWDSHNDIDIVENLGKDDYGFSALPSGVVYGEPYVGGFKEFGLMGELSAWWGKPSKEWEHFIYNYEIYCNSVGGFSFYRMKYLGDAPITFASVRCVKDK